ncbi:MAG TPA: UPF0182 family protein, partial [Acidimicrobiales bacterium]|nr:UPF0182 family protein [Acidimicrobiales bacterium]
MRAPSITSRRLALASRRSRWAVVAITGAVLALLASAQRLATFYTDFLWYRALGFGSVWSKTLGVELGLGATFTLLLGALLWCNLWLADRHLAGIYNPATAGATDQLVSRWQRAVGANGPWVRLVVVCVFAVVGGTTAHTQWPNWLLFSNAKTFPGKTDPIFQLNYGFYVFRLPFLQWLTGWLLS